MKTIGVCFAILLVAGCSAVSRKSIPDGPVEFNVILSGSYSQVDSSSVKLITNQSEWVRVWKQTMGHQEPLPAILTVDFRRQYVIAAFMGERSSSGYRIEIPSIVKKGQILKVTVKKYETPGMLTVMTQPFTLVRVPRGNYRLEVKEESVQ